MIKFVKKISILAIIMLCLLLVINYRYIKTDYYQTLNGINKFYNLPEEIEVANFGNSHSNRGIDWSVIEGIEGANLAWDSQTLVYDFALFDTFFEQFKENSTIVVEVSFRSLYEPEIVEEDNPLITRYYRLLDRKHIFQWNYKDFIKYRVLPLLGDRYEGIKHIIFDSKIEDNFGESVLKVEDPEAENDGRKRAEDFLNRIGVQELGIQYESLIKLIEKSSEKGINVILITAPTTEYFHKNFSKEFYKKYYADMNNICQEYNYVSYIDYTNDERFEDKWELFADHDHLNSEGAKYFTKILWEDITKCNSYEENN